jgi:ABC-2 type transport system permease protein
MLILKKDLLRRRRAPVGTVTMLLMPLVLTAVIGLVFGGGGDDGGAEIPRVKLLIADEEGGMGGGLLTGAFGQGELADLFDPLPVPGAEEGRRLMDQGEASALLVIPANFTNDLLDGYPVVLQVVKNPAQSILPEIAVQTVDVLALVLNSAARLLGEPLAEIRDMTKSEEGPSEAAVLALSSVIYARMDAMGGYFFPMPVSVVDGADTAEETEGAGITEEPEEEDGGGFNIFTFILPGLAFMGILFIGEMAMRDVLAEQTAGTLSRVLTTPLTPVHFLAGKMAQAFILCLACQSLVMISGTLVFGVGWGPLHLVALFTAAAALSVTGLTALIFGLARSERQGSAIAGLLIMGMSLLGGSMFPLEMLPRFLHTAARFTLNFWAIKGFRSLAIEGGGLAEIAQPTLLLCTVGLACTALGAVLLKQRIARGIT